jgi:hypothetical protein
MSIVLDLPPALESKLAEQASQHGLSLPDYVLRLLGGETNGQPAAKTGADLLSYWNQEGLIGTRSDIADSSAHARAIREKAETRQRG